MTLKTLVLVSLLIVTPSLLILTPLQAGRTTNFLFAGLCSLALYRLATKPSIVNPIGVRDWYFNVIGNQHSLINRSTMGTESLVDDLIIGQLEKIDTQNQTLSKPASGCLGFTHAQLKKFTETFKPLIDLAGAAALVSTVFYLKTNQTKNN